MGGTSWGWAGEKGLLLALQHASTCKQLHFTTVARSVQDFLVIDWSEDFDL